MEFGRGNILTNCPLTPKIIFFLFALKNFKKVEEGIKKSTLLKRSVNTNSVHNTKIFIPNSILMLQYIKMTHFQKHLSSNFTKQSTNICIILFH